MTIWMVHSVADLRDLARGSSRVLVPTMGALHEGHAALIRSAREAIGPQGSVVVSVFVNPTQFGAGEDFDRYPRTLADDVEKAEQAGADVVFAPDVVEMYGNPRGFAEDDVTVDPGPLGDILEGVSRRGHYRGVLTVVAKLFAMTTPDAAVFGEKDYQQLVLIRRMARNLSLPVEVRGVRTVRESDGLAMSSRNRFLSTDARSAAASIPKALQAVAAGLPGSVVDALAAGRAVVDSEPMLDLDYLVVTGPELERDPTSGPARILIAARVGGTRLIDNIPATIGSP